MWCQWAGATYDRDEERRIAMRTRDGIFSMPGGFETGSVTVLELQLMNQRFFVARCHRNIVLTASVAVSSIFSVNCPRATTSPSVLRTT